jgi:hypothetical protein
MSADVIRFSGRAAKATVDIEFHRPAGGFGSYLLLVGETGAGVVMNRWGDRLLQKNCEAEDMLEHLTRLLAGLGYKVEKAGP